MAKKPITLQAGSESRFFEYACQLCGNTMRIASSEEHAPHCSFCGEELANGIPVKQQSLTAGVASDVHYIKCHACDTVTAVSETEQPVDEIAQSTFCVNCGSEDLVASDEEGTPVAEEPVDLPEDDADAPAASDAQEEAEEVTQTALEGDELPEDGSAISDAPSEEESLEASDLQWNCVDAEDTGENGTLIATSRKSGMPVFTFKVNDAPAELKSLFATATFVNAFNDMSKKDGLHNAVKAFGGVAFNKHDMATVLDLEAMAYNKMATTALPRFIDCCQMAVEGGLKGIYTNVANILKDTMVNELVASGVPSDRANRAVTNALALHGSTVFGTIISKATDLFNKPEKLRQEAKSMIMEADGPAIQPVDEETVKVQEAMNKPTFTASVKGTTITASVSNNDVDAMRRNLF